MMGRAISNSFLAHQNNDLILLGRTKWLLNFFGSSKVAPKFLCCDFWLANVGSRLPRFKLRT